jgi:DNA modification methylase
MTWRIDQGDVIDVLASYADESVNCVVTSPPYWGLRDYGIEGQLGLEPTPEAYVAKMVDVFREVRRVLSKDGTCWLNLGDNYAGSRTGEQGITGQMATRTVAKHRGNINATKCAPGLKPKDLAGIPWRVAFALQADGWYLRSDIIWSKPNPMPESVTDRPTKAHEYIFLLTKSARYWYDADAIKEKAIHSGETRVTTAKSFAGQATGANVSPSGNAIIGSIVAIGETRNARTVWEIATQPYSEAHFATYPEELVRRCVLAGCPEQGTVLDPFAGSGTTMMVALRHNRNALGIELNPTYVEMAKRRITEDAPLFNTQRED